MSETTGATLEEATTTVTSTVAGTTTTTTTATASTASVSGVSDVMNQGLCDAAKLAIQASVDAVEDYCDQPDALLAASFQSFQDAAPSGCTLTDPCSGVESTTANSTESSAGEMNSFSALLLLLICFFFKN